MGKKLTHQEFLEKLYKKNKWFKEGMFEVVGTYTESRNRIRVKNKYGTCEVNANDLTSGLNVGIKSAIDKNTYCINQFKEIHGGTFDYSLVEYVNQKTPVKILCEKHGIFEQTPDVHKKGHTCNRCSIEGRTTKRETISTWLKDNNFDNSTKVSILTEEGINSKLEVVCKLGHKYSTTFNRRKAKNSCKECHYIYLYLSNNKITEEAKDVKMTFYILRLFNQNREVYKVGITKDIKERISDIKAKSSFNIEILKEEEINLLDAYNKEQYFLKEYKRFKANGLEAFGGHTECFIENPINLENWQYEYYLNKSK